MAPPLCHSLPWLLLALLQTLIFLFHPPMPLPCSFHQCYQYYLYSNQIPHLVVAHNILSIFASLHYPFFLHYSSPIYPPHTSTRSNAFVQPNHLLSNSKHISLTIFSLQHVTVSLPLFTLGLSHYPLRPAFCHHLSPLVHFHARFLP